MILGVGGCPFLRGYYGNSPQKALQALYPEFSWNVFQFEVKKPKGFWNVVGNHRKALEKIGKSLGVKKLEDWYQVPYTAVYNGGGPLLNIYKNLPKALSAIYPEFKWKLWKFQHVFVEQWKDKEVQQDFMEELRKTLKIQEVEDWYRVTSEDIKSSGGVGLLKLYDNSVANVVMNIFPNPYWLSWRFQNDPFIKVPWTEKKNQREFFDVLAKKLDIKHLDDWYYISEEKVKKVGGDGYLIIIQIYKDISKALETLYPEHNWNKWRFKTEKQVNSSLQNILKAYKPSSQVPDEIKSKHLQIFDEMAKKLNMKSLDDWHSVILDDIKKVVGEQGLSVIFYYDRSITKALITLFPEHPWKPWNFKTSMYRGFWDDDVNVRRALDLLAIEFKILSAADWAGISTLELKKKLATPLSKYGGMQSMLVTLFPELGWDQIDLTQASGGKIQSLIIRVLSEIFPQVQDFHVNYLHPSLLYSTGKNMELDIFIPSLKLAIEYHGEQHYHVHHVAGDHSSQQIRDNERRKACKAAGISLIEIPYWWNLQSDSLRATIFKEKPDLFPGQEFIGIPIPEKPRQNLKKQFNTSKIKENSQLTQDYTLNFGPNAGKPPKCRGCGKTFFKRKELRVIVGANFTPTNSTSHSGFITYCANTSCLEKGNVKDLQKQKSILFPPFKGRIFIPDSIRISQEFKDLLPNMESIEFIYESTGNLRIK